MQKLGYDLSDRGWAAGALIAAAVWPIADLFVANASEGSNIAGQDALRWLALILAAGVASTALLRFVLGTWLRAAAVSATLIVLFFCFPLVEPLLRLGLRFAHQEHGAAILYTIAWAGAAPGLALLTRSRTNQKFLCLLVVGMALTTSFVALTRTAVRTPSAEIRSALPARLARRPNVYEFIFDGMGRPDNLKATLGIDVGWVGKELEARGFTVAPNAEATYLSTEPSIHSLLNPSDPGERANLDIAESEVVRYFRAHGYHYNHYGEVFAFSACSGLEDVCISTGRRGLSEVDVVMLRKTPIYAAFQHLILSATTSRNLKDNLRNVAHADVAAPTLTVTYMVPPHPPFIFSADCRADQQDFNDFRAWRASSIRRYEISYGCVAKGLLPVLDAIISRDPSAIILVSGDHGTMFRQVGRPKDVGWTKIGQAERRPVMLAARVPSECRPLFAKIGRLPEVYQVVSNCLAAGEIPHRSSLSGSYSVSIR